MSYDKNQCTFSGKVSDIRQINTKTGNPMASCRLLCWKENVRCFAFGNVAILSFNDGVRTERT